jgi:hypothetical protein
MSADEPGFAPRHGRVQTEREERLRAAFFAAFEDAQDLRAAVAELTRIVMALVLTRSHDAGRAKLAERSAQRAMDAIVDFDVRCGQGDVAGAVAELRAWLGNVAR